MGVFEFVIAMVLISTVGKVISQRHANRQRQDDVPRINPGEVENLRDAMDDLSGRLQRLEEERDFYKDLLDSPTKRREIEPPEFEGDASGRIGPSG